MTTLEYLVDKRQASIKMIKINQETIALLDIEIAELLDQLDVKTISVGDYEVIRREGSQPRKKIDPVLLLSLGVPAYVIEAATVEGEAGKPSIVVRRVNET